MAKSTVETAETKIEEFAEDLGKMLGHARSKAEGWLGQRKNIVKNLTDLRDEATKLLLQLGHEVHEVPFPRGLATRGRPAGSKNAKAAPTKSERCQRRLGRLSGMPNGSVGLPRRLARRSR